MTETEVKLAVRDLRAIKRRLAELGWKPAGRRQAERNVVYDRPDGSLFSSGRLLRIRQTGERCWLTVKGPSRPGRKHKVREEHEIETRDLASLTKITETLGFIATWRYEKFRTEYRREKARGKILLDETPIGTFLELEGASRWIDETAAALGFQTKDYILASYRDLFHELRRTGAVTSRDMVFE